MQGTLFAAKQLGDGIRQASLSRMKGGSAMAIPAQDSQVGETVQVAWWKEPTREQWHAWIAAWLGWTLDAFDFTIFLLLMLPISRSFHVPLVDVTAVLALTLWMRLGGG